MAANLKEYVYSKGTNEALDAEFAAAVAFARVKQGQEHLFWKAGFRWYYIPFAQTQRIFRRLLPVHTSLCCGGANFMMEWLVLVLPDVKELEIYMGEDVQAKAEALLQSLKCSQPQVQFGKA